MIKYVLGRWAMVRIIKTKLFCCSTLFEYFVMATASWNIIVDGIMFANLIYYKHVTFFNR